MRLRLHCGRPEIHIAKAFAEMYGIPVFTVYAIGTLQLCLCKSDEARRILLGSVTR